MDTPDNCCDNVTMFSDQKYVAYCQSWALASCFTLMRHRVNVARINNNICRGVGSFFFNDSLLGDTTKICQEFPTFKRWEFFLVAPSPRLLTLVSCRTSLVFNLLYIVFVSCLSSEFSCFLTPPLSSPTFINSSATHNLSGRPFSLKN